MKDLPFKGWVAKWVGWWGQRKAKNRLNCAGPAWEFERCGYKASKG